MGQIIGVISGKGGTGKTSVCAGIAIELAKQNNKVLCVDCDVGLRNLDISLGMAEQGALSFLDLIQGEYDVSGAAQSKEYPGLSFLTAPVGVSAEEIDGDDFCRLIRELRARFDYILLDAPAGVDAGFRLVSRSAERLLLVTGPGPAAIRDAARVGDILELSGKQDVRLVVNRVDRRILETVHLTVDDVMDSTGLPLIGIVPEDHRVALAAAFGKSVDSYARRCDALRAFRRIARRIQGYQEPIPFR